MPTGQHPTNLLLSFLDGALAAPAGDEVSRHLAACPECGSELSMLRDARALMPLPPASDARPGFAARVAHHAAAARKSPAGGVWRWVLGGGFAVAGLSALALAVFASKGHGQPSLDLRVAQRLELYEDMAVMQHQQALEDLDVVAVLHQLQPEARP